MNAYVPSPTRLWAYEQVCRVLRIRSYAGKILLLSFVAAHIPLLTLAGYFLFVLQLNSSTTWTSILLALMATLTTSGVAFAGLWVLLAPVPAASSALTMYRDEGERALLPTDCSTRGTVARERSGHPRSFRSSR